MVRKAVFLDRDGVINANVMRDGLAVAPTRVEDFRFLPGVAGAVRDLSEAGFRIIVITNQPDLATDRTTQAIVHAMHDQIRSQLPIDDIKMCGHVDADNCTCRKPKPGMLLEAAADWDLDLRQSYLVGDRWKDVEAGRVAGCLTLFVDDGMGENRSMPADRIVRSLAEAARLILQREATGRWP
jgi:D-glycero-D-manno-heptose 1,7-bisphosphate phosphatase